MNTTWRPNVADFEVRRNSNSRETRVRISIAGQRDRRDFQSKIMCDV